MKLVVVLVVVVTISASIFIYGTRIEQTVKETNVILDETEAMLKSAKENKTFYPVLFTLSETDTVISKTTKGVSIVMKPNVVYIMTEDSTITSYEVLRNVIREKK